MNYYSSLNALQYKRKFMLLEPLSSLIHGLRLFFKMGAEGFNASATLNDFLNHVSEHVHEYVTLEMCKNE